MAILLCHHCWSWTESGGPVCADCGSELRPEEWDPSLPELAQLLGTPVSCLQPVARQRRSNWPVGELIALTGGVLFLPRLTPGVARSVVVDVLAEPTRPALTRLRFWSEATVAETPTVSSCSADRALAPEWLTNPQGVFIPCQSLVQMVLRSKTLRVYRTLAETLSFHVPGPPEQISTWLKPLRSNMAWKAIFQRSSVG